MTGTMKRKSNRRSTAPAKPGAGRVPVLHWIGLGDARARLILVLLAMALGSGLLVVHSSHLNRFHFTELQALKNQHNALQVQRGQLLIEQSTFGLEGRIERKAMEQLQMQVPELSSIVVVENGPRER